MAENSARVLIMMGSPSDHPVMKKCADVLDRFGVPCHITVASAHRSPARAMKLASEAKEEGVKVVICAAGLAAHLAGVVAAHTRLPVIGVPMAVGPFQGLDSLLSTVQMPPGVPVATVAAGDAGAANAAHLALRILALGDEELAAKLEDETRNMAEKVEKAALELS